MTVYGGLESWRCPRLGGAGFTLIELMVVVMLIGIISAVAFPHLLPVIMFSEVEGAARHLMNYGRAVSAEAAFRGERMVVRFDLDEQQYYVVHWVDPEPEEGADIEEDQLARLQAIRGASGMSSSDLSKMLAGGRTEMGNLSDLDQDFDSELADLQLADRFDDFVRRGVEARAANVKHDESMLDDIDIFKDDEGFELDEDEPVEEELDDPVLERTRVGEGVRLDTILLDGERQSKGEVEVELTSLGFVSEARFIFRNDEGDCHTVVWDPVTGGSTLYDGEREAD